MSEDQNPKRFTIFDANDYDTCRSEVNFRISTGTDYWFIPYVTGYAHTYAHSEQTDVEGNVSKGTIICYALTDDGGSFPPTKFYTGSDSDGAYFPGTIVKSRIKKTF